MTAEETDAVPEDLVNAREACARLRCSRMTLGRLIAAGKLRAWRPANCRLFFSRQEIERRLRESRVVVKA